MDKIDFKNGQPPYISDETLNKLQENIEKAIEAAKSEGGVSGDTLPIGSIVEFPSNNNVPNGWLLCDGRAVSRTEYDLLFSIIGTIWGKGDGSTTFNLPNKAGLVTAGIDPTDSNLNALGKTYGEKTHTLTVEEIASHYHEIVYKGNNKPLSLNAGSLAGYALRSWDTTAVTETESDIIAKAVGGNQSHNNMQPTVASNFIIKAKQSAGVVATVVDSLDSTSETDALSANQGKILNEKIEDIKTYSTNEQVIGTWINNKPLYRKVIDLGNLPNASDKNIPTGLIFDSNNCVCIKLYGGANYENGIHLPLPYSTPFSNNGTGVALSIINNEVNIRADIDRSEATGFAIIEYIKATD